MRAQLLAALRAVLVLTVLTGLIYPLVVTGLAQVAFGDEADGSLIERDGRVVGSSLIGQTFTTDEYFQGRPSSAGAAASGSMVDVLDEDGEPTGETVPADPSDLTQVNSGASNLGPTNEDLLTTIADREAAYRDLNGLADDQKVPVDAVTASASGVDPQISVANARLQAPRVADARGLDADEVLDLVDDHTQSRSLGFLGEKGVNVLELNLALDDLSGSGRGG
jgi:potassium-transporting ATPase KdpC subunit